MTVLGLDTSNYRTSAALISTDGQVQMTTGNCCPFPREREGSGRTKPYSLI